MYFEFKFDFPKDLEFLEELALYHSLPLISSVLEYEASIW
jgi:hypothetical protein